MIYGISVEDGIPQEKMRTRQELGDSFVMLSDVHGEAGGLYAGMAKPDLHHPATYVIGKDGTLKYEFVGGNYSIRPAAQAVLDAVKADADESL